MEPVEPIRAALLAERARLLDEIGETIVAPGQMTYGSQAAAASQVFAQQRNLALRDRTDHQLELVDEALARLDSGTFGACVRCGRPMAADRLRGVATRTPLVPFGPPEQRRFLKAESLQPIGAFKLRGAYVAIATLTSEQL